MFISKLWRGDFSLPVSYWLFGVFGNILFSFPIAFIDTTSNPLFSWTLVAVTLICGLIVNVGIWRSSAKYQGNKIWAVLAKIAVVLGIATLLISAAALTSVIEFKKRPLLVQECLLNEVLQAAPGLEGQVWLAAVVPCGQSSDQNLLNAIGRDRVYVDGLVQKNDGKLSFNTILLNEVIKEKKFYPIDKYKSYDECKLSEFKRIKNSSPMTISLVDGYCVEYMTSNIAQKTGYDLTGALTEGYTNKEILNYLESQK